MEMKTPTWTENCLLLLLIVAVIACISVVFYFSAKKLIDRVSDSLEPVSYKQQVIEIRG